jgi:hypothetical protein
MIRIITAIFHFLFSPAHLRYFLPMVRENIYKMTRRLGQKFQKLILHKIMLTLLCGAIDLELNCDEIMVRVERRKKHEQGN